MPTSGTIARCDRPSFNESTLHLTRCERRHRLQVGNAALRGRNNKRWHRLLVRWPLEDEQNVVFPSRQVVADKLSPDLGDEAANGLCTILRSRNHSVQAILREAGLCNKGRHVVLLVFTLPARKLSKPRQRRGNTWRGGASALLLCDPHDKPDWLGSNDRLRLGLPRKCGSRLQQAPLGAKRDGYAIATKATRFAYVLRLSGTLPPVSASFVMTCLCNQTFISAEPSRAPV